MASDSVPDPPPPDALFEELLDRILAEPARCEELTAELHARFARRRAILVLDMCGFSRTTQQRGIVTFLLMIRRMRRLCEPCFREHGGRLLKAEADNLFYVFDSAAAAVDAACAAQQRITAANRRHPDDDHLFCAIGIGYGEVLDLGCDLHGHEVNLACKLGEDVASDGQILLTAAAHAAIDPPPLAARQASVSISGLELTYHEFLAPGTGL
jgi:class 3 adenylate cyclase